MQRPTMLSLALLVAPAALVGCASLPSSGPIASQITVAAEENEQISYEVIDLNDGAAAVLKSWSPPGFGGAFQARGSAPSQRIDVGDVLTITIYESAPGGLFSPPATSVAAGSRQVLLPSQTVDRDGQISVPYGGRVRAAGMTPAQLSRQIEAMLVGKAIQPQAIVTLQSNASQSVSVVGEATGGGRVALNIRGERLLDVVSQAGGIRTAPHETLIRLIRRGGNAGVIRMSTLLARPSENVYIQPGDTIYIHRDLQTFTALGAVLAQGTTPIERDPMTLSEAIGKAAGLSDGLADTTAIFLFRWERPELVRRLRPNSPYLRGSEPVPVVYRLSLAGGGGFLLASQIPIRNRDILYVANAPSVQFLKFIAIVRGIASTARSIQAADPNNY